MKGVIYYDLLEHGRIITLDIYCQQFDWCYAVILQHVNVRVHSTKEAMEKIKSLE